MIAVGCDWARRTHQFVVLSPSNEELACFAVPHRGEGLAQVAEQLRALEPDPSQIRLAIEGHSGPLMDWLEDQSYAVFSVNPKTSSAARNLLSSSGNKDDKLDAKALAQLVLLRGSHLTPLGKPLYDRGVITLVLRQREQRVRARGDLLQHLSQMLQEWAPALATLCKDPGLDWTRELLRRWPLERDFVAADPRTLRAFTAKLPLRQTTRQRILEARKTTPLPLRPERLPLLRNEIRSLLTRLDAVIQELRSLEVDLARLVEADPAHPVLQTLPGASIVTEAAWLATFAGETDDWRSASCHNGTSPVTRASGCAWGAHCRRSRDPMLQRLITYHAFQTTQVEGSWAQQTYAAKRERDKGHYTTLRGVAQRWVKIVHAMLRDNTPYDEATHRQHAKRRFRPAA